MFKEFTAHLDAGEEIGMLRPLDLPPLCREDTLPSSTAILKTTAQSPEGLERLLRELKLHLYKLSPEVGQQLKTAICDFSDVFALDDMELGCIDLVQYSIETGNHPPIRQQPYRTPVIRLAPNMLA